MNRVAAAIVLAMLIGGCSSGGKLAVRSAIDDTQLTGNFDFAVYSFGDANTVDVVLVQGTADDPQQVVHVRMLWRPKAAHTPMDRRATNATVSYVLFNGDQAGVYGGGGLLFPRGKAGRATFRGRLENATLRLLDASDQFNDQLKLAVTGGSFTANLDPSRTMQVLHKVQVALREKLGYPRFVKIDDLRLSIADSGANAAD
jgi:hypothetical protein